MGIFRTIASTLVLIVFVYISHQLTRFTDLEWHWQTLIVSFLAFLFSMIIGTFLFFFRERSPSHSPWKDRLLNASMTALAYVNFLGSLVILRDLFAFAEHFLPNPMTESLYSTQATMTIMGLPVLFIVIGNGIIQMGPRHKKIPIAFQDLPNDLENLRILHLTDLHIGDSLPTSFVQKLVERIQSIKPHIVVLTGDILDGFIEKHQSDMNILGKISAPYGVYFVPGNHEYYWDGVKNIEAFRKIGFNVLINQTFSINIGSAHLQIAGVPDPAAAHFQSKGPDFSELSSQLHPESFKIILSHQPSLAKKTEKMGFHLQLSGHTHGGQFFPWNWLIVFFERYSKGLYRLNKMQLYVNQGTGYWGPQLRLGTYCELAEIILRKN